jgi:hypothetical protein
LEPEEFDPVSDFGFDYLVELTGSQAGFIEDKV